jgi:murein DD-endopeptidase MepM/ murein hydrolase activator NlpD
VKFSPQSRWKILFLINILFLVGLTVRLVVIELKLSSLVESIELKQDSCEEEGAVEVDAADQENFDNLNDIEENTDIEETSEAEISPDAEGVYAFSVPVTASFFNTFANSSEIKELSEKTGNKRLSKLLSAHIARNLVFTLDMRRDVYPGDQISAVFRIVPQSERREREDMPDEIEILAMRYRSVRLKRELRSYRFKPSGYRFETFFDENGVAVEKMLKNSPMREWIQITALLNDRRPRHDGVDFKAPVGTPVYAPWSGRVLRTNWSTKYNGISLEAEVDTNPKVYMILLHLDKLHVKSGASFKAGDHIADVGNTGRSFAPHLHYQLQRERGRTNRIIDPIKFHGTIDRKIPETDKTTFETLKNEMDRLMKEQES